MIATLYSYEPIITSIFKLGVTNLYLIIDKEPDNNQETAINKIKETFDKHLNIQFLKLPTYDLYEITKEITNLIDNIKSKEIILNASCGRKTKSLGLMYAGYCRSEKIKRIIYVVKEDNEIIDLPIINFELNKNEYLLLSSLEEYFEINKIMGKTNISRSQIYKIIEKLKKKNLVSEDNKIITSGKIFLLKYGK